MNNEKLKESGFALDGVTVNGYVNENGIAINVNSQKALNSVVGHEITHVLEGTELYGELTEWVKKYANIKEKDGYNNRLKQLISLYQSVEGYKGAEGMAKIHQEAVADLVGDFLFTDQKFLQRLLENRNLFQRLWDEIKYLATVTSGTEEARRLAELQRAFEKAYNGETKKPTQEGGVKYSILHNVVDVNGEKYDSVVKLDKSVSKSVLSNPNRFLGYIENNLVGLKLKVFDSSGKAEIIEFARPDETVSKNEKRHPALGELAYAKGDTRKQVIVNAKEVIETSLHQPEADSNENSHGWLDENGWKKRSAYVLTEDGMIYKAWLRIARTDRKSVV